MTAPTSGPDGDDLAVPDILEAETARRPPRQWRPVRSNVRALDRFIREWYGLGRSGCDAHPAQSE